jgi:hypothetical protein
MQITGAIYRPHAADADDLLDMISFDECDPGL